MGTPSTKAQHTVPFSDRLSPATVKIRLSSPAHDQQQLLTVGQLETLQWQELKRIKSRQLFWSKWALKPILSGNRYNDNKNNNNNDFI